MPVKAATPSPGAPSGVRANPFSNPAAGRPGGPGGPNGLAEDEVFEDDFTDVTAGPALVTPGTVLAVLKDFEKTEAKSGNEQYEWTWEVINSTAESDIGKSQKDWTSLVPAARWRVVQSLEACGIPAAGSICRFKKADLIGKPAYLDIYHDDYNGRITSKVGRVNPPDEEALKFHNEWLKTKTATPG